MFAIRLLLAGMGSTVAHWSIGLIIIAACVAGELFIGMIVAYAPLLKPATKQIQIVLLAVAFGTGLVLVGEWLGARDMAARCDAKAEVVNQEVTKQVGKAVKKPGHDQFEDDNL